MAKTGVGNICFEHRRNHRDTEKTQSWEKFSDFYLEPGFLMESSSFAVNVVTGRVTAEFASNAMAHNISERSDQYCSEKDDLAMDIPSFNCNMAKPRKSKVVKTKPTQALYSPLFLKSNFSNDLADTDRTFLSDLDFLGINWVRCCKRGLYWKIRNRQHDTSTC